MSRENLWAPWRISYVKSVADQPAGGDNGDGCFMCEACAPDLSAEARERQLVLYGNEHGVLMLNRYPYTNGHLLIVPPEHVADMSELSAARQAGLMGLIDLGNRLLQNALNPQGMNVGLNMGRCAGAGKPGHVHFHVVPRWHGDVNMMDVVGEVRVIPQALHESYRVLAETLSRMNE